MFTQIAALRLSTYCVNMSKKEANDSCSSQDSSSSSHFSLSSEESSSQWMPANNRAVTRKRALSQNNAMCTRSKSSSIHISKKSDKKESSPDLSDPDIPMVKDNNLMNQKSQLNTAILSNNCNNCSDSNSKKSNKKEPTPDLSDADIPMVLDNSNNEKVPIPAKDVIMRKPKLSRNNVVCMRSKSLTIEAQKTPEISDPDISMLPDNLMNQPIELMPQPINSIETTVTTNNNNNCVESGSDSDIYITCHTNKRLSKILKHTQKRRDSFNSDSDSDVSMSNNNNNSNNNSNTNNQATKPITQTQSISNNIVKTQPKKPGQKGYRKTGPRERKKRDFDMPQRRKALSMKRILTHGDRIIAFMLSNASRNADGTLNNAFKNQVAKNCKLGNYMHYGFSCKRSKTFISKWFSVKIEDITTQGLKAFIDDKNYVNCGPKYKIAPHNQLMLTANFLAKNSKHSMKGKSVNKPAMNKKTFARREASKWNVSERTIERTLDRHIEPYVPPRVQPNQLTDVHKEARLKYCKRMLKMGKQKFFEHFGFADEFTLNYNGTVVTHDKCYRLQTIAHEDKYMQYLKKHEKKGGISYADESLDRIKSYYQEVKQLTKSDLGWYELFQQSGITGRNTLLLLDKVAEEKRRLRNKTMKREHGTRISFICFFGFNWRPNQCVPMGQWKAYKTNTNKFYFDPDKKYSAAAFNNCFISKLPNIKQQGYCRSDIICTKIDNTTKDLKDVCWILDNSATHTSSGKTEDSIDIRQALKANKIKYAGFGGKSDLQRTNAGYPPWSPDFMPVENAIFPIKHKAYTMLEQTMDSSRTQKEEIIFQVKEAWNSISQNTLNSYIEKVWSNMQACVKANGDFGINVLTRTKKT